MALAGWSHISMTVSDLDRSSAWYADVLGWSEVGRGRSDHTAFAHGPLPGGGTLVLRQHDQPGQGPFDETRPGLDHLSLVAESGTDLAELEQRVISAGLPYTPSRDFPFGRMLTFRDPDGIALEAIAPPGS